MSREITYRCDLCGEKGETPTLTQPLLIRVGVPGAEHLSHVEELPLDENRMDFVPGKEQDLFLGDVCKDCLHEFIKLKERLSE